MPIEGERFFSKTKNTTALAVSWPRAVCHRKAALSQSCHFALFVSPSTDRNITFCDVQERVFLDRHAAHTAGGPVCCDVDHLSTNAQRTLNESMPHHTKRLATFTPSKLHRADVAAPKPWWPERRARNFGMSSSHDGCNASFCEWPSPQASQHCNQ